MKQYVIDELRPGEAGRLNDYFTDAFGPPEMGNLYWITVPENRLSETQLDHQNCRPFFFAVEIDENKITCELLVRTKSAIRCNCIAYATAGQREWFISTIDDIFEKLDITT